MRSKNGQKEAIDHCVELSSGRGGNKNTIIDGFDIDCLAPPNAISDGRLDDQHSTHEFFMCILLPNSRVVAVCIAESRTTLNPVKISPIYLV